MFEVVMSLLVSPVIESALRQDVAKLFVENFAEYTTKATEETKKHAK